MPAKTSSTKLAFDYGYKTDYATTASSSYTADVAHRANKTHGPHVAQLAPFGTHNKDARVGVSTGRPNAHFRLAGTAPVLQGQGTLTKHLHEEEVEDAAEQARAGPVVAPSHGTRMVNSRNVESELAKHRHTAEPNKQLMTTASERELQADYADYIYVDDFNRYRTLQLEAESFGDNGPGPLAASSIKPQPFYGIRRPPRHKIEPNWAKVAEKAKSTGHGDYDIISHMPSVKREQPGKHADSNGFPFSTVYANTTKKTDFRRQFTILRPMSEHYKRGNAGSATWMDEVGSSAQRL